MAKATLTTTQGWTLRNARGLPADARSIVKKEIFAAVKQAFAIPDDHRIKVEVDETTSDVFLVVRRKKSGAAYELNSAGRWVGSQPVAPVAAPVDASDDAPVDASDDAPVDASDDAPAGMALTSIVLGFSSLTPAATPTVAPSPALARWF